MGAADSVVSRIKRQMVIGRDVDLDAYADADEAAYIRPVEDYIDDVWDHINRAPSQKGSLLPWDKTHQDVQLRRSALYLWTGERKQGKSLVTSQVMMGLMNQGERVVIAPTEMDVRDTLERMERQALAVNPPTRRFHDEFYRWAASKLWLYETPDGLSPARRMLGLCRYAVQELGATQILIDSLMMVRFAAQSSFAKNEGQIDFARQLVGICKATGVTIHLVAHHKKADGSTGADRIKGAGDLPDLASGTFTIAANVKKQDERNKPPHQQRPDVMEGPDLWLKVENQRHGPSGSNYSFWLHPQSLQILSTARERVKAFVDVASPSKNSASTSGATGPKSSSTPSETPRPGAAR